MHRLNRLNCNFEVCHKEILGEAEPYQLKLLPTLLIYCKIHVLAKEDPCVLNISYGPVGDKTHGQGLTIIQKLFQGEDDARKEAPSGSKGADL